MNENELRALLRALKADIEAMSAGDDAFGPFEVQSQEGDGRVTIEWPNLALLLKQMP